MDQASAPDLRPLVVGDGEGIVEALGAFSGEADVSLAPSIDEARLAVEREGYRFGTIFIDPVSLGMVRLSSGSQTP